MPAKLAVGVVGQAPADSAVDVGGAVDRAGERGPHQGGLAVGRQRHRPAELLVPAAGEAGRRGGGGGHEGVDAERVDGPGVVHDDADLAWPRPQLRRQGPAGGVAGPQAAIGHERAGRAGDAEAPGAGCAKAHAAAVAEDDAEAASDPRWAPAEAEALLEAPGGRLVPDAEAVAQGLCGARRAEDERAGGKGFGGRPAHRLRPQPDAGRGALDQAERDPASGRPTTGSRQPGR